MTLRGKSSLLPTLESVPPDVELLEPKVPEVDTEVDELVSFASPELDQVLSTHEQNAALESLVATIEQAQSMGRYHCQQIKTSLESLAAYPDAADYIPALEAFDIAPERYLSVSLEGLRATVRKTLETILTLLSRFWALLNDAVERVSHSTILLRARVTMADSRLRDVMGRYSRIREVDASRLLRVLSTDRYAANEYRRLMENLTVLQHQLVNVRRQYIPMVSQIAREMISIFERWGQMDAKDWLERLNEVAAKYDPIRSLTHDEPFRHRVSPQFDENALMGRPLPGRKTIVILPAGTQAGDLDARPTERATALQAAHVTLAELRDVRAEDEMNFDPMPVLSQNQIEGVLAKISVVLDEIDRTTKDDNRRELRRLAMTLDNFAKSSRTDVPDGTVMIFQAGVAYATAVSRWIKEPYLSLINHSINVCNNTVRMCNLHTRAYSPDPEEQEISP